MKNIDCEVYISQLITFFETNPNDLINLIGDIHKDLFYKRIKEVCYSNLKSGEDYVLTKEQILNIVVDLKIPQLKKVTESLEVVEKIIQRTKWGDIILN
jgi:hypothetical protein